MRLRALLVDDEPLALERLQSLLEADPDVSILGSSANGLEALKAIRALKPDLLILDIQMPEMDGFELLAALEPEEVPIVVFATAYDHHAIRAFEARAVDYLLKPFSAERLKQAVGRAVELRRDQQARDRLQDLLQAMEVRRKERFVVRNGGGHLVLRAGEVDAIEAEANYMWIHRGQDAFPLRATLATLEKSLDPDLFVRVHRSWMLNVRRVTELLPGSNGGVIAVTTSGVRVPVSAAHRRNVEVRLA